MEVDKAVEIVPRTGAAVIAALIAALARAAGHVGAAGIEIPAAIGTAGVGGIGPRGRLRGGAPVGATAEGGSCIVGWGGH